MRRIFLLFLVQMMAITLATAQVSPYNCSVQHKDSCWYVTFDYDIEKIPSSDGMIVVTHLCNTDTCISSAAKHFQGKKYNKRYIKRHGHQPHINKAGNNSCTIILPENYACDTVWGITYSEYSDKRGTSYALDTTAILLPAAPSLSCHRVSARATLADHIAQEHPYVKNIRYYTPLQDGASNTDSKEIVRYRTNSALLDTDYMRNAKSIEDIMSIINSILADSSTTVESVQIVGYNSPESDEEKSSQLGYQRAVALRNHIRAHHHLHDSIFEVADGRRNWHLIYKDISMLDIPQGDSLIEVLKKEPSPTKREIILRRYEKGELFKELARSSFAKHRAAAINAIYYHNLPDSAAIVINEVTDELSSNPSPDYHKLLHKLRPYKEDARAINLRGVIDYRRHRLHAAEKFFTKAAEMGDEQAALNLIILNNEKEE